MKKYLILATVVILGCATEPEPANFETVIERTKVNFASVNEKIFDQSDVMFNHNYSQFSLKDYDKFFNQYRFDRANQLREDQRYFDKREIYSYNKTFIICTHLTKANYTLCDDPRCPKVEKSGSGGKELVEKWLREIPWENCPRHPNTGLSY